MGFELTHEGVLKLLGSYRLRFGTEDQLQCDLKQALTEAGLSEGTDFVREHRLCGESRIDFYLPPIGLGIECKVDGSYSAVYQQLIRYAEQRSIESLILVSRRKAHAPQQEMLRSKPIGFVWVGVTAL